MFTEPLPELGQPREYLPFQPGPFRLSLGLRPLDAHTWIELDRNYRAEMQAKQRLLAKHRDETCVFLPGSEAESETVRQRLAEHLVRTFPAGFSRQNHRLTNHWLAESWPLDDPAMHPLEQAARWVPEDLCLMEPVAGAYCLTAAVVAFPSRWRVREKLGQTLRGIHAPVAFYEQQIADGVDRYFEVMTPQRSVWRVNWNLHETPELFQLEGTGRTTADPSISAENAGQRVWLRIERQTLRRLSASPAVLFTIRTYVRPIQELADRPQVAANLAAVLRATPPLTQAYKSQGVFLEATLAWLDRVAAGR